MDTKTKTCNKCGATKLLSMFSDRRLACRDCLNADVRKRRHSNLETFLSTRREYYHRNKEKLKSPRCIPVSIICFWCKKEFSYLRGPKQLAKTKHYCSRSCAAASKNTKHGLHNTIQWCMWNSAKCRAKKLGLPFNLTLDAMPLIPGRCPVLDIPLDVADGSPRNNSPSLDRIIPSLGYVHGNVRVISFRANTLRNNATARELRLVAEDAAKLEEKSLGRNTCQ